MKIDASKMLAKLTGPGRPDGIDLESLRRAARIESRKDRPLTSDGLKDRADRLHELAVLSLFLHSAGTLEEMLSLFLERSPRVTGAIVTYPLILDRRREVLSAEQLATIDDRGLDQASLACGENLSDIEYPLQLRSWRRSVMEGGEVALLDNLSEVLGDVLKKPACDHLRSHLEISKVAVVPLVMEGEAFGLCVFMFSGNEPDVEILELAAGHCTLAIKALLLGEEATRFGGIDPVTWAHSRGYFHGALDAEVIRARRYGRGLSLVVFDIDNFGEFNASYGHSMGDRLLRGVAMTLAGSVSLPEVVARYGGDEFVLLLPESHRAQAVQLTSNIIDKLNVLSVFDADSKEKGGVQASVAIVSYPEDGATREELLAAAEVGLEQAKQERREQMNPRPQLSAVQQLRIAGRRNIA